MSMYLDFEPDYWYKGHAIARFHNKKNNGWLIYFEDSIKTYGVFSIYASTLKGAKNKINYRLWSKCNE